MTRPSDIPEWALKAAMSVQDAAEAECKAEKYVYGFGTGNAKTVLDRHIARALVAAQAEATEAARKETREQVLDLLLCHVLYRYRPKAFDGFVEYVRNRMSADWTEDVSLPSAQRRGE